MRAASPRDVRAGTAGGAGCRAGTAHRPRGPGRTAFLPGQHPRFQRGCIQRAGAPQLHTLVPRRRLSCRTGSDPQQGECKVSARSFLAQDRNPQLCNHIRGSSDWKKANCETYCSNGIRKPAVQDPWVETHRQTPRQGPGAAFPPAPALSPHHKFWYECWGCGRRLRHLIHSPEKHLLCTQLINNEPFRDRTAAASSPLTQCRYFSSPCISECSHLLFSIKLQGQIPISAERKLRAALLPYWVTPLLPASAH